MTSASGLDWFLAILSATGIFLLILGVDEIFMALIPSTTMGLISIFVSIAALVGMIIYIRKMLGD